MTKDIPDVSCSICRQTTTVRHFDLYVFGSEGIQLCEMCRRKVCSNIHAMAMDVLRQQRDDFIEARKNRVPA